MGVRMDVAPDVLAALVERDGEVVACNRWAEKGRDLKGQGSSVDGKGDGVRAVARGGGRTRLVIRDNVQA